MELEMLDTGNRRVALIIQSKRFRLEYELHVGNRIYTFKKTSFWRYVYAIQLGDTELVRLRSVSRGIKIEFPETMNNPQYVLKREKWNKSVTLLSDEDDNVLIRIVPKRIGLSMRVTLWIEQYNTGDENADLIAVCAVMAHVLYTNLH